MPACQDLAALMLDRAGWQSLMNDSAGDLLKGGDSRNSFSLLYIQDYSPLLEYNVHLEVILFIILIFLKLSL